MQFEYCLLENEKYILNKLFMDDMFDILLLIQLLHFMIVIKFTNKPYFHDMF